MTSHWNPGDPIVLREVWRGRVWSAKPVTVIADMPAQVALRMTAGTRWKMPRALDSGPVTPENRLPSGDWQLVDRIWQGGDALFLITPGAAHAVYAMWQAGNAALDCWYINLQDPIRRTAVGFDYMDHLLDVVMRPDRTVWTWKDEEEFAWAQAIGVIAPTQAAAIRREGERAIALAQANAPPFSDGWESWSPPAAWGVPDLPKGWDIV